MKQRTELKGKNREEVGSKEYLKILNEEDFMLYLHRKSQCEYYNTIVTTSEKINHMATSELKKLENRKKKYPEILPEDDRKAFICLYSGLKDICAIVKKSTHNLDTCIKTLSSVHSGSKKYNFSKDELREFYGSARNIETYISNMLKPVFAEDPPAYYQRNGGDRKYGKALKEQLESIAVQIYADISNGDPATEAIQEDYKYNINLAQEQLEKCGVRTKGDWDEIMQKYTYRDITKELQAVMDESYERALAVKYEFVSQSLAYSDFSSKALALPRGIASNHLYFASQVMEGAPYDLKAQEGWQDPGFVFDGKELRPDAPGNILYGYFGAAMGFPEVELLVAGGVVQIATRSSELGYFNSNFDDPYDQEMVRLGVEYYKKQHGDTLIEVLQDDLENALDIIPHKDIIAGEAIAEVAGGWLKKIAQTWGELYQKLKTTL